MRAKRTRERTTHMLPVVLLEAEVSVYICEWHRGRLRIMGKLVLQLEKDSLPEQLG